MNYFASESMDFFWVLAETSELSSQTTWPGAKPHVSSTKCYMPQGDPRFTEHCQQCWVWTSMRGASCMLRISNLTSQLVIT
eukprot:1160114-Pelagomonas_calceolata.AAC.20